MVMNGFDFSQPSSVEPASKSAKSALKTFSKNVVTSKNSDFRKVLEHLQQKSASISAEAPPKESHTTVRNVEQQTQTGESIQTDLEERVELPEHDEEVKDKDVIAEIIDLLRNLVEMNNQQTPESTEQSAVISLEFTSITVETNVSNQEQQTMIQPELKTVALSKPQQESVAELVQLLTKLQSMLASEENTNIDELKKLLAKLVQLLKTNAELLESNVALKKVPVAQLMLMFDQMTKTDDQDFIVSLQKLLAQLQQKQNQANASEPAQQAIPLESSLDSEQLEVKPQSSASASQDGKQEKTKTTQPLPTAVQTESTLVTTASATSSTSVNQPDVQVSQNVQPSQQSAVASTKPEAQTYTLQQMPAELMKMMKNFRFNRINGSSEARFALNPEQLGHVNVKISVTNGIVVAHIFTDNSLAKDMLDAQLLQLRAALTSQGLTVEKLEVFSNDILSQQFSEQRRQQSSQNFTKNNKKNSNEYVDLDAELADESKLKDPLKIGMGATLDVTA